MYFVAMLAVMSCFVAVPAGISHALLQCLLVSHMLCCSACWYLTCFFAVPAGISHALLQCLLLSFILLKGSVLCHILSAKREVIIF
jgi:hypothetical protein